MVQVLGSGRMHPVELSPVSEHNEPQQRCAQDSDDGQALNLLAGKLSGSWEKHQRNELGDQSQRCKKVRIQGEHRGQHITRAPETILLLDAVEKRQERECHQQNGKAVTARFLRIPEVKYIDREQQRNQLGDQHQRRKKVRIQGEYRGQHITRAPETILLLDAVEKRQERECHQQNGKAVTARFLRIPEVKYIDREQQRSQDSGLT